jgi:hypothetical protein
MNAARLVAVPAARGAGYVFRRAPELSVKARRLGLETRADVEREFVAAKRGWSKGTDWHCPFCNKNFVSPSGARKHMRERGCLVLRMDWYEGD